MPRGGGREERSSARQGAAVTANDRLLWRGLDYGDGVWECFDASSLLGLDLDGLSLLGRGGMFGGWVGGGL